MMADLSERYKKGNLTKKDFKMDGFAPANHNFNSPKNIVPHNFSNRPVTRSQVQVKLAASNVDAGVSKVIHSKQKILQKQKKPKSSSSKSNNELVDQEQPSTLKVTHRKPLRKADSNASNSDDELVDQEQPSTSKITQRKRLRKTDSNTSNSDDESMDQEKSSTVSGAPKMVRFALAHRNFNLPHNIEPQAFTNRPVTRSQGQMKLPTNNVTARKADSNAVTHLKQKTLQKQKKSKSSASNSNKRLVDQEKPSTVSAAPKMVTFVSPPKNIEPQIVTNRPVTRLQVKMTLPAMDQKSPLAVSEVPVITRPTRKRSQKCNFKLLAELYKSYAAELERLVGNKSSTSSSTRSEQKNLKESQEVAVASSTLEPAHMTPCILRSRGKDNQRKEYHCKKKLTLDADTTSFNSLETLNNVLPSTTPDVEATVGNFPRILENTISDVEKLCDQWRLDRKETTFQKACNMIDVVIGQSQLLIRNNSELFQTLINQNQTKENTKKITCEDLHGVWDMLSIVRVSNLEPLIISSGCNSQKRFDNLRNSTETGCNSQKRFDNLRNSTETGCNLQKRFDNLRNSTETGCNSQKRFDNLRNSTETGCNLQKRFDNLRNIKK